MDYLAERDLIRKDTEVELLGNRIVLVAPADSDAAAEIAPGFDLAGLLGDGRLAMANVDAVPAGKYGKAALTSLGVWDAVARPGGAGGERARRAGARLDRRGAARHRLCRPTPRPIRAVKVVGTFPEDTPPADRLSGRGDRRGDQRRRGGLPRLPAGPEAAAGLFEAQGFTVLAPVPTN